MNNPSFDSQAHASGSLAPPTAIVCDFDDTTADRNVAALLLDAFHNPGNGPHWQETQKRFAADEISLAEYQEITFSQVTVPQQEQAEYAIRNAALRPGFRKLVGFCSANGIEIAIASHGLAFYVTALLREAGVAHLPVYAVEILDVDGEPRFVYNFPKDGCPWAPGNCKCKVVEGFKQRGMRVLYAGDGASDACPARLSDFVFARATLLRVCRNEGLPHRELTDFHVVLDFLQE